MRRHALDLGTLRRRAMAWLYPVGMVVLLVGSWKLAIVLFDIEPFLLPPPEKVFAVLVEEREMLIRHSMATLQAVVTGFLIAVVLGFVLGVAMASWTFLERLLYPPMVATQGMPKSAMAPLFVIWFGFGTTPKIIITMLIAFFPVVVATLTGFKSVPTEMLDLGRSMGLSRLKMMRMIEFPTALPSIFSGLKVAIALSVIGTIVAEFVASDRGLGYLLILTTSNLRTDLTFGALTVLGIIGVVLFALIERAEKLAIPWHVSTRRGPQATPPTFITPEAG